LIERLDRGSEQSASELVADIVKRLQKYMQNQPQADDIALLALRRVQ
jgi:serine phosphatase RsbU (regulator of sigma subunit)